MKITTPLPHLAAWRQRLSSKVGARLSAGFAMMSMMMLCLGASQAWLLYQHDQQFGHVLDSSVPQLTALQNIGGEVDAVSMAARDAILANDEEASTQALARIEKGRGSIGEQIQHLQTSLGSTGPEGAALADELGTHSSGILVTLVKFSRLHKAKRVEQAKALFNRELQGKMQALSSTIHRAQGMQLQTLAEQKHQSRQRLWSGLALGAGILLFAIVLSAVLAWRLARSITVPVTQAMDVARRVSQGDLSTRIDVQRHDEIGLLLQSMASMQQRLSELVQDILHAVHCIEATGEAIACGNEDLNERTGRAAQTLNNTSGAMTALATTFQQAAESARHANELVAQTNQGVSRSGEVVAQVVHNMRDITVSSAKISDIIGVIDSIAFQTNILALNAAVEAARAGEQGRGFAVVASEVRALAQRSATAAREIKSLIQASTEKVQMGSALVGEAGTTMSELIEQVDRVSALIRDISDISEKQTHGVGHVNVSVSELNEATRCNATLVHKTSEAAETLKAETLKLAQAVGVFRLA